MNGWKNGIKKHFSADWPWVRGVAAVVTQIKLRKKKRVVRARSPTATGT